eukprot:7289890-Pyramimonas_sp.AAC.4
MELLSIFARYTRKGAGAHGVGASEHPNPTRLFAELAYGDRQRGQHITPGAVLLFELEILKVKGSRAELK